MAAGSGGDSGSTGRGRAHSGVGKRYRVLARCEILASASKEAASIGWLERGAVIEALEIVAVPGRLPPDGLYRFR